MEINGIKVKEVEGHLTCDGCIFDERKFKRSCGLPDGVSCEVGTKFVIKDE